jgi:ElaB/YqjD/DUF883 family membrane-anchored ribosome-binding protein
MDQRTGQIVEEILEERQRVGDDIAALERKVKEATAWQGYFARKPWMVVALAVGSGFLLSTLLTPKSH